MATKVKRDSGFRVNVGSSSILLIFVILCLVSFATLSIVSANADAKLSNRVAERTTAYYEACNQAERSIASLDRTLAEVYASTLDEDDYFSAVGHYQSYEIDISNIQTLHVAVDILYPQTEGGPFYRITSWQVITSTDVLEFDEEINLLIP